MESASETSLSFKVSSFSPDLIVTWNMEMDHSQSVDSMHRHRM